MKQPGIVPIPQKKMTAKEAFQYGNERVTHFTESMTFLLEEGKFYDKEQILNIMQQIVLIDSLNALDQLMT